jgi:hypothetical protein
VEEALALLGEALARNLPSAEDEADAGAADALAPHFPGCRAHLLPPPPPYCSPYRAPYCSLGSAMLLNSRPRPPLPRVSRPPAPFIIIIILYYIILFSFRAPHPYQHPPSAPRGEDGRSVWSSKTVELAAAPGAPPLAVTGGDGTDLLDSH